MTLGAAIGKLVQARFTTRAFDDEARRKAGARVEIIGPVAEIEHLQRI